jgi:hypothetical protein
MASEYKSIRIGTLEDLVEDLGKMRNIVEESVNEFMEKSTDNEDCECDAEDCTNGVGQIEAAIDNILVQIANEKASSNLKNQTMAFKNMMEALSLAGR